MQLTVKELKNAIQDLQDDVLVYFQHIDNEFLDGYKRKSVFNDELIEQNSEGWQTIDMPCDTGCDRIKNEQDEWDQKLMRFFCMECPHRSRYINGSRCFIRNGKVFIDGHY